MAHPQFTPETVTVGIVTSGKAGSALHHTVESVRCASPAVSIVLITPPGPAAPDVQLYRRLPRLRIAATDPYVLLAALLRAQQGATAILLAEGVEVTPNWLALLLPTFDAVPACGAMEHPQGLYAIRREAAVDPAPDTGTGLERRLVKGFRLLSAPNGVLRPARLGALPAPPALAQTKFPLVSCIMPTRDRANFVAQALAHFDRQDYPNRELVIVYDNPTDLPVSIRASDSYRLLQVRPGASIGEKRNAACLVARGEIIAQWDDDDWYSPGRLTAQVAPILDNHADITALSNTLFYDATRGDLWECAPEVYRHMFFENVHGGTLVYRRRVWESMARYPPTSLREDADFLQRALSKRATLARVDGRQHYIYFRHGSNSWTFAMEGSQWNRARESPAGPGEAGRISTPALRRSTPEPLVSCTLLTRDRPQWIRAAIDNFLEQDYANKELIILDSGSGGGIRQVVPADSSIHYTKVDPVALGTLRNQARDLSSGELISHWDDDDWRAPDWIRRQVEVMAKVDAQLCGLTRMLFCAPDSGNAWRYDYPPTAKPWVAGGSLCYRRSYALQNPFPPVQTGEDTLFVWSAAASVIAVNPYWQGYVARIHAANTSRKVTGGSLWSPIPLSEVEDVWRDGMGSASARAMASEMRQASMTA